MRDPSRLLRRGLRDTGPYRDLGAAVEALGNDDERDAFARFVATGFKAPRRPRRDEKVRASRLRVEALGRTRSRSGDARSNVRSPSANSELVNRAIRVAQVGTFLSAVATGHLDEALANRALLLGINSTTGMATFDRLRKERPDLSARFDAGAEDAWRIVERALDEELGRPVWDLHRVSGCLFGLTVLARAARSVDRTEWRRFLSRPAVRVALEENGYVAGDLACLGGYKGDVEAVTSYRDREKGREVVNMALYVTGGTESNILRVETALRGGTSSVQDALRPSRSFEGVAQKLLDYILLCIENPLYRERDGLAHMVLLWGRGLAGTEELAKTIRVDQWRELERALRSIGRDYREIAGRDWSNLVTDVQTRALSA